MLEIMDQLEQLKLMLLCGWLFLGLTFLKGLVKVLCIEKHTQ